MIELKFGNKVYKFIKWPLATKVSEKWKKKLDKAIDKRAKEIRNHFNTGAWDIDEYSVTEEILYDVFGFHLMEYVKLRVLSKLKGVTLLYTYKGGPKYKSNIDRVFYSPVKNKLYISKVMKDVNSDVQLGDL